jgi:hypothetical protein
MSSDALFSRWQSSQSDADYGAYLDALIAEGRLTAERVALAGGLFHAGARASSIPPVRFSEGYRGRITRALASLSHRQMVEFAVDCGERILPAWKEYAPDDARVPEAIRVTRDWLAGQADRQSLKRAVETAVACAESAMDAMGTSVIPEIAHALSSATAAANAARCAKATNDMLLAAAGAGAAAKCCADSAENYIAEVQRQTNTVSQLLLRPDSNPVDAAPAPAAGPDSLIE